MREIAVDDPPRGTRRELLQAVLQHPGLKKIKLAAPPGRSLAAAEADILPQVFAKMEEIELVGDVFGQTTRYLIDTVLQRSTKIKKASLE